MDVVVEGQVVQRCSVHEDCEQEIQRHRWIESEKAGRNVGEEATRAWVKLHWNKYLRARWIEHMQGTKFWLELDKGDFGILKTEFKDCPLLLDRILDRLITGQENLNVQIWAQDWGISSQQVIRVLEILDVNSRRLACKFE